MSIPGNQVVMFPSVTYNEGSGYNSSTGKFTAPVSGVYAFTKQTCTIHRYAHTALVHNNQTVLTAESYSNMIASCTSAYTFVQMSKRDQMWVITTSVSHFFDVDPYQKTSFAGALVVLL